MLQPSRGKGMGLSHLNQKLNRNNNKKSYFLRKCFRNISWLLHTKRATNYSELQQWL